ncbi:MAG TPA: HisA/HisF-related TIM barrel protein, partial [Candidatus Gracilibacteria bacterium]|nr:HisA/HisF-related TIM barrel protein [Candidatus Gracilibacteria bacterium]
MEIIPAIYVLDGKVVALYKGSIDQKETYGQAPVNFAQKFQREGAQRLYVEDINARMHMKIAQPE